jgi:hypothetical protein
VDERRARGGAGRPRRRLVASMPIADAGRVVRTTISTPYLPLQVAHSLQRLVGGANMKITMTVHASEGDAASASELRRLVDRVESVYELRGVTVSLGSDHMPGNMGSGARTVTFALESTETAAILIDAVSALLAARPEMQIIVETAVGGFEIKESMPKAQIIALLTSQEGT